MGKVTFRQDATSPSGYQTTGCIYTEAVRSQWYATKATACYTAEQSDIRDNRYLPDKVLDFFNDEFDYRELANWQDLQNLAMAYFTLITSPYEVTSGGGGGGSQSDLKWGRDPKEDEIEFARRCAQAASNRIGRHSKGGIKRK